MLKCLNIDCVNCKENQCKILCENSNDNCASRIIPRHTPNYAEEQLEHAIEKENKCYRKDCTASKDGMCCSTVPNKVQSCLDRITEVINYEVEYCKVKKENEELNKENADLQENSIKYYNVAKDLKREKRELEGRLEAIEFNNKTLEKEITERNNYIISLESKIEELEKELKYEEQQKGMTKVFLDGRTNNLEKELHKYKDIVKTLAGLL